MTRLPCNTNTERQFLSAALIAPIDVRHLMLEAARPHWFLDEWHRWLFTSMVAGYGLQGRALLEHLQHSDRESWHQFGSWMGRMVNDKDGRLCGGWVNSWELYAAELKRIAEQRNRLLSLLEQIEELENAYATDVQILIGRDSESPRSAPQ